MRQHRRERQADERHQDPAQDLQRPHGVEEPLVIPMRTVDHILLGSEIGQQVAARPHRLRNHDHAQDLGPQEAREDDVAAEPHTGRPDVSADRP